MNMAIDFQETEEQLAREMNRATEAEASVIELMLRDNGQFRSASLNSKWFASSVWRKVYGRDQGAG